MKKKADLDFGDIIKFKNPHSNHDGQIGGCIGKTNYFAWQQDYYWMNFKDENDFEYLGFDPNIQSLDNCVIGEFYYVLGDNPGKEGISYKLIGIDYSDTISLFKMKWNTSEEKDDYGGNYFWCRIISKVKEFSYTNDTETGAMINANTIISISNEDEIDDAYIYLAPQPKALL